MLKEFLVCGAIMLATENPPDNFLSGLMQYGPLGIIAAILLWKDYKQEQFLQHYFIELKSSIDKLTTSINRKIDDEEDDK